MHLCIVLLPMIMCCSQAMHAQSSVAVGMKGATKAMAAMSKVLMFLYVLYNVVLKLEVWILFICYKITTRLW